MQGVWSITCIEKGGNMTERSTKVTDITPVCHTIPNVTCSMKFDNAKYKVVIKHFPLRHAKWRSQPYNGVMGGFGKNSPFFHL